MAVYLVGVRPKIIDDRGMGLEIIERIFSL